MSYVDVVISTYDRPASLGRCLRALEHQTFSHFRVIVVDDCSPRPAESAVRESRSRGLAVTLLRTEANGGPAAGRNLGVLHGDSPVVLFLDDDVAAETDLVEQHVRRVARGVVVIGPLRAPPDGDLSPWAEWEARTLEAEYRRMIAGEYQPTWRQFFTGNASLRRSDFESAGGFNTEFFRAEDIELGLRLHSLGCRFVFAPDAVGWHYASRSLASWKDIPRTYARSDAAIDALYPETNWLALLAAERADRHTFGRWTRRAAERMRAERPVTLAAILAARGLHRVGMTAPAMAGLSLAYELLYEGSLRQLRAAAGGGVDRGGRALDGASGA